MRILHLQSLHFFSVAEKEEQINLYKQQQMSMCTFLASTFVYMEITFIDLVATASSGCWNKTQN